MATKQDVARMAFRKIGVVSEDEAMTADQFATASDLLDSIYAELQGVAGPYWTVEDVAPEAYQPLATLLAVDLADAYTRPAPTTRGIAKLRVMSAINPDDRSETVAEYY